MDGHAKISRRFLMNGSSDLVEPLVEVKSSSSSSSSSSSLLAIKVMNERRKLFIYAFGIFISYFYFGILQEKITRTKYGQSKEIYTCTMSLVLIQCIINALFAKFMLATFMKQPHDNTKTTYYATSAFTYLTAMITSNMALQHVNYPTQVVGKSCKPIPVMILGVLLGRKQYPLAKYLYVLLIVAGVGIFIYKDTGSKSSSTESPLIGAGELLLLLSLAMDGFTGAIQDRMINEYQSKSGHMMLQMNLWSTIFLSVAVAASGEIWTFIDFVNRYPDVIYNIMAFSALSAIGQMFIFLTVAEFGPLPCSIITTTRKFFTVLASVLFFGNVLSLRQWFGVILVFTGLSLDSIYGKKSHVKK